MFLCLFEVLFMFSTAKIQLYFNMPKKGNKILAVLFGYYSENDYICKLKKKRLISGYSQSKQFYE